MRFHAWRKSYHKHTSAVDDDQLKAIVEIDLNKRNCKWIHRWANRQKGRACRKDGETRWVGVARVELT